MGVNRLYSGFEMYFAPSTKGHLKSTVCAVLIYNCDGVGHGAQVLSHAECNSEAIEAMRTSSNAVGYFGLEVNANTVGQKVQQCMLFGTSN